MSEKYRIGLLKSALKNTIDALRGVFCDKKRDAYIIFYPVCLKEPKMLKMQCFL